VLVDEEGTNSFKFAKVTRSLLCTPDVTWVKRSTNGAPYDSDGLRRVLVHHCYRVDRSNGLHSRRMYRRHVDGFLHNDRYVGL